MPEPPPSARLTLTSLSHRLFVRRVVLPWLLQGDQPAGEGLEIGAGRGVMTAELLARFPRFRMVATDYSTERITSAEQILAGFGRRVSVQRADAAQLPFADGRFDLVLSAAMLHHVIEWDQALSEAVRVLRPGGRLVGYDMLDTPPIRLMHIAERDSTLLLRAPQLGAALGRLGLTDLRTATAVGGAVMRFSARKAALPPSGPHVVEAFPRILRKTLHASGAGSVSGRRTGTPRRPGGGRPGGCRRCRCGRSGGPRPGP